MKNLEDGKRYDEEGKELAYWKGKAEGLQEALHKSKDKVTSTGSMFKQSFVDHTVRYIVIGFFSVSVVYGSVWYISKKTEEVVDSVKTEFKETVSSVKTDIKDAIDIHPIKSTKKWFKSEDRMWYSDENKTIKVLLEKEEIRDKNKTSTWTKITSWASLEKDENITKDIIPDVVINSETVEIEVTKIDDNRTFAQKAKGKWNSIFSKKKENNETKE